MRTLFLVSLAAPGALAGYMVLMGYLIGRIRPVPISFMPQPRAADHARTRRDERDDELEAVAV